MSELTDPAIKKLFDELLNLQEMKYAAIKVAIEFRKNNLDEGHLEALVSCVIDEPATRELLDS